MMEGTTLGVSLDITDGLILGTYEGIKILYTDGNILGSSLRASDGI